jgi:hypothetical protein
MTPSEALAVVRRFGTVEAVGGALKIRVPKGRLADLETAFEVLRNAKTEVLSVLAKSSAKTHLQPAEKPEPSVEELSYASAILGQAGVRLMRLESGDAVGIWSDLDSPDIRNALRIMGSGGIPILYLDAPGIPLRYKLRRVPGEPVPAHIHEEMERNSKPWEVRDRSKWRFIPWTLAEAKPHTIDPQTRILPIGEWGAACGRGFVSDPRFGANQQVIPRTSRATTRKWRKLDARAGE